MRLDRVVQKRRGGKWEDWRGIGWDNVLFEQLTLGHRERVQGKDTMVVCEVT